MPRPPMKRKSTTQKTPSTTKRRKMTGDYQKGRELAKAPKQELKAADIPRTTSVFNTTGTGPPMLLLSDPINGAELYQRTGRKTYGKSIHVRGWVRPVTTAVQTLLRIIIFYDANPNGVAPTIANLLQDSSAAAATSAVSEINLTNRQRFKILRDIQWQAPSFSLAAGVVTNQAFSDTTGKFSVNEFIKLKGLETVFNGVNGGTVADIQTGAIFMTLIDDQQDTDWNLIWTSRYRYYD